VFTAVYQLKWLSQQSFTMPYSTVYAAFCTEKLNHQTGQP